MPTIVIKPERDRDLYVAWSTIVEAPVAWGDRASILGWAWQDWHQREGSAIPGPLSDPDARLTRADQTGTSAAGDFAWFGAWDYEAFIYEQRGCLPRARLADACEALGRGDEPAVWDLLEPFEDQAEAVLLDEFAPQTEHQEEIR